MRRVGALALALACAASAVSADARRYPPQPVDRDREQEQRSRLWEATLHPERATYTELVAHARPLVLRGDPDSMKAAIVDLDKAIALAAALPEAHELRGRARERLADYAGCADDLALAEAAADAPGADDRAERGERVDRNAQRTLLGTCQARAGRYALAERTLSLAVESGARDATTWMRLGETRVALGKLDQAIAALIAATEADLGYRNATVRWLLAGAYDRARMPNQAADQLVEGYRSDRGFASLRNPQPPLLGEDEADYLLGLAWGAAPDVVGMPSPERQLAHFRRFLARAKTSPWRRRAEEHVRELSAIAFPETLLRGLAAPVDLEVARATIRKGMPAMRACLAHADAVVRVEITRSGPRSPAPPPVRDPWMQRRLPAAPPDGTNVYTDDGYATDAPTADVDAAKRCVQAIADKLTLPAIKDKDVAYKLTFLVIAP